MIAVVLFLVSREATFTMMSMSGKYFAAANDAEKTQWLAAGRTLLEVYNGSCFDMSYVLGGIVTLILSIVMLKSKIFSKATAIIGIVMSVFMLVPPTVGPFGLFMSMLSLIPTMIWLMLVGRGFIKLAKE